MIVPFQTMQQLSILFRQKSDPVAEVLLQKPDADAVTADPDLKSDDNPSDVSRAA